MTHGFDTEFEVLHRIRGVRDHQVDTPSPGITTGTITIPDDYLQAVVHYTSRTPTYGHLREAFVVSIEPAQSTENADIQRQTRSIT
jgi:hypothetical protein